MIGIIKKCLWISVIICIMLLPFLTADAFKPVTYLLYTVFSILLLYFAVSEKVYLKDRSILTPLFLWLSIIFITSIYAVSRPAAFDSMGNMFFCALIFIVLSGLDSKRKEQIALTLIAGSFFVSIRAIAQYFFIFDHILPFLSSQDIIFTQKEFAYISDIVQRQRVVSTFVGPNLFASYLVMVNIIIVPFCLTRKNRYLRLILSLLLIMNCYALWLSRSATGLLSFIFGIFLFIILFSMKKSPRMERYKRLFILLSAGLFALFIVLFISRLVYERGTDSLILSLRGRMEFWRTALRVIADRPLQFTGLGGFGYLYRLYAPYARFESMMAHNIFLQLWIETGVYGLLTFIWFLSMLIRSGLKNLLNAQLHFKEYIFQAAALIAMLVFLFHNMLDFSFFVTNPAVIWWLLCAFFISNNQGRENIIA
jgi:putative inorganic carbon (hco3(-)) transporter